MKRPARKLALFLLLLVGGAIINIAVAWTFPRTALVTMHDNVQTIDVPSSVPELFPFSATGNVRTGWPMRSMMSTFSGEITTLPSGFTTQVDDVIEIPTGLEWLGFPAKLECPLRAVWPGFAINTAFYAAALWLMFAAPFALRRSIRRRRGLCPACAYPVGASDICTECGKPIVKQKAQTQKAQPPTQKAQTT